MKQFSFFFYKLLNLSKIILYLSFIENFLLFYKKSSYQITAFINLLELGKLVSINLIVTI